MTMSETLLSVQGGLVQTDVWVNSGSEILKGYLNQEDFNSLLSLGQTDSSPTSHSQTVEVFTQDGTQTRYPISQIYPADTEFGFKDSTTLKYLNSMNLLANVTQRYLASYDSSPNAFYSFVGWILIALNPLEPRHALYDIATMQQYYGSSITSVEPHPFALAEQAYTSLLRNWRSQTIIISGESGAGKTECSKHVLKYLAFASQQRHETNVHDIEDHIQHTNPILEAFGNAKTLHNDNSSRFGKLVKLHFNASGKMTNASIQTYLLAKSRVSHAPSGERNYHIFHLLCSSATVEESRRWFLARDESAYTYTNHPVDARSVYTFDQIRCALNSVGLADKQDELFKALSLILALGNLTFSEGTRVDGVENVTTLEASASLRVADASHSVPLLSILYELFGLRSEADQNELHLVLTSKKIRDSRRNLTLKEAKQTADSLSRSLYQLIFEYLIRRINCTLDSGFCNFESGRASSLGRPSLEPEATSRFIGILDIFGFENLHPTSPNGFEQLLINYANEKLHGFYLDQMIAEEKQLYINEGLQFEDFSSHRIAKTAGTSKLLAGSPSQIGVFNLLDEASLIPVVGDKNEYFCEKVHSKILKSEKRGYAAGSKSTFVISHYAGDIQYSAKEFCEKNVDDLSNDMKEFLISKCQTFISSELCYPFLVSATARSSYYSFLTSQCSRCAVRLPPKRPSVPADATSSPPEKATCCQVCRDSLTLSRTRDQKFQHENPQETRDGQGPSNPVDGALSQSSPGSNKRQRLLPEVKKKTPLQPEAKSLTSKFLHQMDDLLGFMRKTKSWFIRCIRPNATKTPRKVDSFLVLKQLETGGMVETLKIMSTGFPCRVQFNEMWKRFHAIMPESMQNAMTPVDFTHLVLAYLKADTSDFQIGRTSAFFRFGVFAAMEAFLKSMTGEASQQEFRQATYLMWLARKRRRCLIAVRCCVHLWLSVVRSRCADLAREACIYYTRIYKPRQMEKAAVIIQKSWRQYLCCQVFTSLKRRRLAAITIQKFWRSLIVKLAYQHFQQCVTCIQRWWKGVFAHKMHQNQLLLARKLQSNAYCLIIRRRYLQSIDLLRAATKIQREWRTRQRRLKSARLAQSEKISTKHLRDNTFAQPESGPESLKRRRLDLSGSSKHRQQRLCRVNGIAINKASVEGSPSRDEAAAIGKENVALSDHDMTTKSFSCDTAAKGFSPESPSQAEVKCEPHAGTSVDDQRASQPKYEAPTLGKPTFTKAPSSGGHLPINYHQKTSLQPGQDLSAHKAIFKSHGSRFSSQSRFFPTPSHAPTAIDDEEDLTVSPLINIAKHKKNKEIENAENRPPPSNLSQLPQGVSRIPRLIHSSRTFLLRK